MSQRIEVVYGVDLPTSQIAELHTKLETLHPGTIAYCEVMDDLTRLHKAFLLRLDGEALAYSNIAKEQTKKAFFND